MVHAATATMAAPMVRVNASLTLPSQMHTDRDTGPDGPVVSRTTLTLRADLMPPSHV